MEDFVNSIKDLIGNPEGIAICVPDSDAPKKQKCYVWKDGMMIQVPCDSIINPPEKEEG